MSKQSSSNTLYRYNNGAIALHWIIALLIIIQLVMGFTMVRIPQLADALRFSMFQWHKTFGILVLVLTVIRILWRIFNKPPHHAPMARIELFTANIVSFLFYALMLLVPLTGWLIVSFSPTSIPTFFFTISGLVWPNLPVAKSAANEALAAKQHMVLAYSFVVLLFLHIGGALKHMVIDRVPELSRMLPTHKLLRKTSTISSRYFTASILVIIIGGGLLAGQNLSFKKQGIQQALATNSQPNLSDTSSNWVIDYTQSTLSYSLDFSGKPEKGAVGNWDASILFTPDELANSKAKITLNSDTITYDDSYVAANIKLSDGLDTEQYPQIKIILDSFEASNSTTATKFIARGTIDIRGVSLPIELPFEFSEENGLAHVTGSTKIERLPFGIGEKNDADGKWLGKIITIYLDIKANKK